MFGVNDTENLHFAIAAKQLGNGLDEQLERFVREHPDTKLIIVDTLQKVRDATGEAYSYAGDYEIVGRMKQFVNCHNICVLFVHHTRKQPEWSGSATELVEQLSLDLPVNAITKRLNVKAGKLQSDYNIRYENKHSRNGSRISLTLLS